MEQRYTAAQFIEAVKGTGGVISAVADRVGCSWHTAKKYIEQYATVKEAWENERHKITDKARHNIIKAIGEGDLQMSKWWLQMMDEEFVPQAKLDAFVRNLDFGTLTRQQLERIADGEDVISVLASGGRVEG